jgi:hypothetical protein
MGLSMLTRVTTLRTPAGKDSQSADGQNKAASSFAGKVEELLERIEYRRCESGEDIEAIYRLRYKAYRLHGFVEESSDQMVTDDLDDAPNCYRFGVFIDGELVGTVRIHHISKDEPYGPVMKTFDDILRPRLERGESFINPTMLAAEPYYRSPLQALPYLTLRLGLVASVYRVLPPDIRRRSTRETEDLSADQRACHALRRELRGEPGAHPEALSLLPFDAGGTAHAVRQAGEGRTSAPYDTADREILSRRCLRPPTSASFQRWGCAPQCRWHYGRNNTATSSSRKSGNRFSVRN